MRTLAALLLALWASHAAAQSVQQSGAVTPTHGACWTTNGVVQDCGTSSIPYLTTLGVQSQGNGICQNSGPATGPYNQICIGNDGSNNGIITFNNLGGQSAGTLSFYINGVLYPFSVATAAVSSVANTDGSLVISPTVGNVIAGINLAHGNVWTANQTFSKILLNGSISGTTTLQPATAASGTLTFPALTDNLVSDTSTDTLTNKTYDTAATGNTFKINGTGITAISGNSATVATATGTLNNGHCVSIDSHGNFIDAGGACTTGGGGGTVNAGTAGQIAYYASSTNAVSGNGNFTVSGGALTTGTAGSQTGTVLLSGGTSGTTTLAPVAAASGTATFPANSGTVAELNLGQTWSAAQTFNAGDLLFANSGGGATTVAGASSASNFTATFPANTGTLAELNLAQTWSAAQTFNNNDLLVGNASTGATTVTGTSSASNFTATLPANTGTLAELNLGQTWSAAQNFNASDLVLNGSSSGATTLNAAATAGTTTATLPNNTGTIAELNLAQTWSANQSYNNGNFLLKGSSSGSTTLEASATASGVITLPAVTDTVAVLGTADQTLSGGANVTSNNLGTKTSGTFTVDCGLSPLQYFTNGGTFTIAPPANDGSCDLLMTNNGSAVIPTFSVSFTVNSNTGEAITAANGAKFIIHIEEINGTSTYFIKALQ